ncbi:hypothetical protein FHS42_005704 [Streptomyces zagrosensis]|uniref:Uncharacterized protein n=1 Tax=Streptomyces zagrosensis TaxID=1042984 RepID=A0A7W9QE76_9ACTN|nr:hypothetical protein [Streptomyces zagrosensis]
MLIGCMRSTLLIEKGSHMRDLRKFGQLRARQRKASCGDVSPRRTCDCAVRRADWTLGGGGSRAPFRLPISRTRSSEAAGARDFTLATSRHSGRSYWRIVAKRNLRGDVFSCGWRTALSGDCWWQSHAVFPYKYLDMRVVWKYRGILGLPLRHAVDESVREKLLF